VEFGRKGEREESRSNSHYDILRIVNYVDSHFVDDTLGLLKLEGGFEYAKRRACKQGTRYDS
jgi:hypothetical protein